MIPRRSYWHCSSKQRLPPILHGQLLAWQSALLRMLVPIVKTPRDTLAEMRRSCGSVPFGREQRNCLGIIVTHFISLGAW
jgi:hypothetical protein